MQVEGAYSFDCIPICEHEKKGSKRALLFNHRNRTCGMYVKTDCSPTWKHGKLKFNAPKWKVLQNLSFHTQEMADSLQDALHLYHHLKEAQI